MGRRLPAAALLWFLGTAIAAPSAAGPATEAGHLLLGRWRGSLLTRSIGGTLCLLRGPDGSLRAEVATGRDASAADLFARRGDGWTIVLAASGDGTVNAWDREWSRLRPDARAGLQVVAEALLAAAAADPVPAGRPHRRAATRRHVLPSGEPDPDLRTRLGRRGRGRGGTAETILITGEADAVSVRSLRRPGLLRCDRLSLEEVAAPPAEAFVPLWPLRDLLGAPPQFPGTSGPAGG